MSFVLTFPRLLPRALRLFQNTDVNGFVTKFLFLSLARLNSDFTEILCFILAKSEIDWYYWLGRIHINLCPLLMMSFYVLKQFLILEECRQIDNFLGVRISFLNGRFLYVSWQSLFRLLLIVLGVHRVCRPLISWFSCPFSFHSNHLLLEEHHCFSETK